MQVGNEEQTRECKNCGKEFKKNRRQEYCCSKCRLIYNDKKFKKNHHFELNYKSRQRYWNNEKVRQTAIIRNSVRKKTYGIATDFTDYGFVGIYYAMLAQCIIDIRRQGELIVNKCSNEVDTYCEYIEELFELEKLVNQKHLEL